MQFNIRTALAITAALASTSLAGFTVTTTDISTTGSLTQQAGNTFAAIQTGDLTKLAGQAGFNATGAGTFTFHAAGGVTANAGDFIRVSYDFTLGLSGTGTLDYQVVGSFTQPLPFPLPPITVTESDDGSLDGPVSQQFIGSFVTPAIPIDVNGTYTIDLIGNWAPTGITGVSTLSVNIPPNSIDLEVIPAPEPTSAAALAVLTLVRRRR